MQSGPPRYSTQGQPMRPSYPQGGYASSPRPGFPHSGPPISGGRMGMPNPGMSPHPPFTASSTPSTTSMKSTSNTMTKSKDTASMPRAGMPPPLPGAGMDRKRPSSQDIRTQHQIKSKRKKKIADKILPQRVRDLVPESQAYMDLLAFERKLDATIMRKRLDIQEVLKRPMKQKRKLRIFISNTFFPPKEAEDGDESVPSWELRVEGRLLEDPSKRAVNLQYSYCLIRDHEHAKLNPCLKVLRKKVKTMKWAVSGYKAASAKLSDSSKIKRKFSSFFKSLVIELDKELYGLDNHLVEWHRTPSTQETDGFQVKRPGDQNVKCKVLLMLDYQPMQFKLDHRLARLLGIHTQTRPFIVNALWQYIKTHKLQDSSEREYINCDKYFEQIFECKRMKFSEIPSKLQPLLMPPDPIIIHHVVTVEGPDAKKTACYDIDVEIDDTLKQQMNAFVMSTQNQTEIANLDAKIHETVENINMLKTQREFFLGFAKDPQEFISNFLISQTRDLKTMTDVVGNPEEERRAEYFYEPWTNEGVNRYFYSLVQQRRLELEQALMIRNGGI